MEQPQSAAFRGINQPTSEGAKKKTPQLVLKSFFRFVDRMADLMDCFAERLENLTIFRDTEESSRQEE